MAPLSRHVQQIPWDEGTLLWNPFTGRGIRRPASLPSSGPLFARLEGEGMLEGHGPALAALVPCRSRRVLLLPERPALWCPLPLERGAGGYPYRALTLDRTDLALWRACNEARTVGQVAAVVGVDGARALAFFARLTRLDTQALQLRRRPPSPRDPGLDRLVAPPRPRGHALGGLRGEHGETSLRGWHGAISDAATHFDVGETTLAHAFAPPHPALGGEPYGARLFRTLAERWGTSPGRDLVVEVGPGSGELGAAWRDAALAANVQPRLHLRLDASPALLSQQGERQSGTCALRADACSPPLRNGSVDLLICNEVIADLDAVPWDGHAPDPGTPQSEVAARVERYGLPRNPGVRLYNLGAWRMIEAAARLLAPGGGAWISEFGDLDEDPTETSQLDHPEVSIHFGEALAVARGLGLEASVESVASVLGFDLHARWLARGSFEALRALAHARGERLESRAWTPETLPLPERVEGLRWVPITQDGPGPVVTRFQALVMRKRG